MDSGEIVAKTSWQKIKPWLDRDQYFFVSVMLIASFFFFYLHFSEEKVRTDNDLYSLTGNFSHYSFRDKVGYRNTSHAYYFWLENYSSAFQIKADFIRIFHDTQFMSMVRKNQRLHLTIPKRLVPELNNPNKKIYVLSVESDNVIFLDKDETIKIENSRILFYSGIGFMALGTLFYFFRKPKIKSYNTEREKRKLKVTPNDKLILVRNA